MALYNKTQSHHFDKHLEAYKSTTPKVTFGQKVSQPPSANIDLPFTLPKEEVLKFFKTMFENKKAQLAENKAEDEGCQSLIQEIKFYQKLIDRLSQ